MVVLAVTRSALGAMLVVAVRRSRMLEDELRRLAVEHPEEQSEGVDAGEERAEERRHEQYPAIDPTSGERCRDDRVLRPEACERRDSHQSERANEKDEPRPRHELLQPAHLPHVLLAGA